MMKENITCTRRLSTLISGVQRRRQRPCTGPLWQHCLNHGTQSNTHQHFALFHTRALYVLMQFTCKINSFMYIFLVPAGGGWGVPTPQLLTLCNHNIHSILFFWKRFAQAATRICDKFYNLETSALLPLQSSSTMWGESWKLGAWILTISSILSILRTVSDANVTALTDTSKGCTTFSSRMLVMAPWRIVKSK